MTARSMIVRTKLILRMGFCVAMVAMMVLVGVVMANAKVYSGECGEYGKNITWTLDTETGVLSVDGYGCMKGYSQKVLPSWYSYREYIKEVTISSGITTIGSWSFYDCDNLEKVYIPESVTQIYSYAFCHCGNLEKVYIPESVTKIYDHALAYCKNLKEVNIPSQIKTIEEWTFGGCESLETVQIPRGVTTIEGAAFSDCNLRCIEIPDSVTVIDYAAFIRCPSLNSINVASENPVYHSAGNCLIETASGKLTLGCQTSMIPQDGTVKEIGNCAFYGRIGLTEITLPTGLISIGNNAFEGCISLTEITFPQD